MAQITNEEKARRESINTDTKADIHRALDKACVAFGDVKKYKKGNHHERAVQEALASWVPNVSATTDERGNITLSVGPPKIKKARKAKAS